jgi:hypothetical protein
MEDASTISAGAPSAGISEERAPQLRALGSGFNQPVLSASRSLPVLIMLHGGGFSRGDKSQREPRRVGRAAAGGPVVLKTSSPSGAGSRRT